MRKVDRLEDEDSPRELQSVPSAQVAMSRRSIIAGLLGAAVLGPATASRATDVDVGCVIKDCAGTLARCVTDPTCAAELLCIQSCNGKPDEGSCQIQCNDWFDNDVVARFNTCAVSEKKCVPKRQDDGSWPVPAESALVKEFNTAEVVGNWYITAGLNTDFDTFDCQFHKFTSPEPGKIVGQLQWRIKDPVAGTNFITKATEQRFVQDPKVPGIFYNHDNDYLHYQDDWYVLAHRPGKYFLVYYRGTNDAWDGYGGAFLYTRTRTIPREYLPELDAAMQKIGRRFTEFKLTNNVCKPRESLFEEVQNDVVYVKSRYGSLGQKKLQQVERVVEDEALFIEKIVEQEAKVVEQELEKDLVAVEKEVEKDLVAVEKEVEKDAVALGRLFKPSLPKPR